MKMRWSRTAGTSILLVFGAWLAGSGDMVAQGSAPPPPLPALGEPRLPMAPAPLPDPSQSALTNMVMRPVGDGVFELGKVRFDKVRRTVTFPAVLNQQGGPIEYFLVTAYGKVHESVLRTEAEPYHIHLAMLLLDAKGGGVEGGNPAPGGPAPAPGPINNPFLKPITGDRIMLEVSWQTNGNVVTRPAEDLVYNSTNRTAMTRGAWTYNGSMVMDGMFLAQRDGSLIALIGDPMALINNPRPGNENDDIWTVNTNQLPVLGMPVNVTIKLAPSGPSGLRVVNPTG